MCNRFYDFCSVSSPYLTFGTVLWLIPMHQGNEAIERRNLDTAVYEPTRLDCILLTHAHIDHSGLLPRLVRTGFSGRIFCTPPTRDLLGIMTPEERAREQGDD